MKNIIMNKLKSLKKLLPTNFFELCVFIFLILFAVATVKQVYNTIYDIAHFGGKEIYRKEGGNSTISIDYIKTVKEKEKADANK